MAEESKYALCGLTSLSAFLGDFVVYRNMKPADERLPGWQELRPRGESSQVPRKMEPEYAKLLALILQQARALISRTQLTRVLYIGDTRYNDGTAFRNLLAVTGWQGYIFIGCDEFNDPPRIRQEGNEYLANRWRLLPDFLESVRNQGFPLDEATAVVIDLDKTAIGARGRNDKVIDAARIEGVQKTIAGLLSSRYNPDTFLAAYNELNRPPYHPFTGDNQDYLAYICLMVSAGLYTLSELLEVVHAGRMRSFLDFIAAVNERQAEVAEAGLLPIHKDVWVKVQEGDPTPFKAFRYNEYLATAARFGDLPGATVEQVLSERIAITEEVRQATLTLQREGVLCFGVSDKPDEASWPQPEQAARGYRPLHCLETISVKECAPCSS